MTRTRIKICGLTRPEDVHHAVQAGADAVGFVLYEHSPRAVSLAQAQRLAAVLPPLVTPVLLFVHACDDLLREAAQALPQALWQFHGDETPAECDRWGRPYLRAVRMQPHTDLLDCARQFAAAQGLVLDAHVQGYGGGGRTFDWSLIPRDVPVPVVLSGGLSSANVIDGILQVRPWAVDVSSGVEQSKGIKDAQLMRRFCQAVRQADERLATP